MLILSRKEGQSIMIGNSIEITVTKIDGNQTIIGVRAPREVPVHRKEVYQRIKQENNGGYVQSLAR